MLQLASLGPQRSYWYTGESGDSGELQDLKSAPTCTDPEGQDGCSSADSTPEASCIDSEYTDDAKSPKVSYSYERHKPIVLILLI